MKKKIFAGVLMFCLGALPMLSNIQNAEAMDVNADDIEVKIYTKQGGEWFKVMKKSTSKYGTLKMKKMMPGKYRMEVDEDDQEAIQMFDLKAQMFDEKGREFDEKVDVEVYAYIDSSVLPSIVPGDDEILVGIFETDSNGEIELKSIIPEMEYKIDVDEEASLGQKKNRPRIKVKSKIEDSDWFYAAYERVDETNTLYLTDVISGKYKMEYKNKDVSDPVKRFNLYVRLRDDKGKKIRKSKKVKVYTYINDQKIPVGEFMTTKDGKLYLPNVMPGEYKIDVK